MTAELDARVAVEIFGWTPPPNTMQSGAPTERWRGPDGFLYFRPPAYSSDWAAFGELLEELAAKSGRLFWPPIAMLVGKGMARVRVNGELIQERDVRVALCRAALKAKEACDGT